MDNVYIAGGVGIVLFLLGVFTKDKMSKRAEVRKTVTAAAQTEQEGAKSAELKYDARLEAVRADAARKVDSRPVTGDAGADLSDRLSRHSGIVRRHKLRRQQRANARSNRRNGREG